MNERDENERSCDRNWKKMKRECSGIYRKKTHGIRKLQTLFELPILDHTVKLEMFTRTVPYSNFCNFWFFQYSVRSNQTHKNSCKSLRTVLCGESLFNSVRSARKVLTIHCIRINLYCNRANLYLYQVENQECESFFLSLNLSSYLKV